MSVRKRRWGELRTNEQREKEREGGIGERRKGDRNRENRKGRARDEVKKRREWED